MKNKKWKFFIGISMLTFTLYILFRNGLLSFNSLDEIGENLQEIGLAAVVWLMLLIVIQQIITFVPFLSLATVNVMIYGFWGGFFLSWISSLIGALLAFWLARNMLHDWIYTKWGHNEKFQRINKNIANSGFFYVLMGRLFPIMPSNLINFGAGISQLKISSYFIATIIGNIPFVFTSSLMAHDLLYLENDANQERFTYVSIGLAAFVIVNLSVKYFLDKRKQLDRDTSN